MNIKDKYDVIVIGAGIGGLSCGALLAKEGLSVLVAEQHSKPGGYCTSFRRKGFTFDAGIEYLAEAEEGGMLYNVLEALGLKDEIKFIDLASPNRVVGTDYNIPPMPFGSLAEELKRMFPGEGISIDAFVQDCKAVTSEVMALLEPAPDLLGFGGKMGLMIKYLFKSPRIRKYGGKSFRQTLTESFKEPRLQAILGSLLDLDTGWAATAPMLVLGHPASQYPEGGVQALADAFARGVTKHGGELAFKNMVNRIMVEDGQAIGIELSDGTRVNSRYVISNVDGRQTFLRLIGEQHLKPNLVKELKETRVTGSAFLVSLGVDINLKAMGFDGTTIIYNRSDNIDDIWSGDPEKCSLWIMMHSLRDPSQAPEGMATVQLASPFPYDSMSYWKRNPDGTRGKEYKELKEALADRFIAAAEEIIPGLSQHIICKDVATPLTFERYTLNGEGASHGWLPIPGAKMRSQKTLIRNLYQAGHWTFPGSGIFTVAVSGKIAAQLVLKDVRRK
jgi:all-trans-retinol 13,14-reductase